jgi:hypothetical protein
LVDTLRADAIPPVRTPEGRDFARPGDTPFMDGWLESSYRFTNAYTAAVQTHTSMPSMMRSVEVFENSQRIGAPLARRAESLGYRTGAVVTDYVALEAKTTPPLLDGIEEVVVFGRPDSAVTVPSAKAMMTRFASDRFFLWVHFYAMHEPGFDGELLDAADGPALERYRRSLVWLDGQMAELIGALEELGIADRTIVVLASDHGEGLGDHGHLRHGGTLFEEDVHAPLAFFVPGLPGAVRHETVGNIDIVPTLLDLIGEPLHPDDRGRSLVPTMLGHASAADETIYFQTSVAKLGGLVSGPSKLIYDRGVDVLFRFDLDADPNELRNAFDPNDAFDQELVRRLIGRNPKLLRGQIDAPEVAELVAKRLAEVDPAAPTDELELLLRLAQHVPNEAIRELAPVLFEGARDDAVRLLVLRHLWGAAAKPLEKPVAQWLAQLPRHRDEAAVVSALAQQGQPAVATKTVANRMMQLARGESPREWEPWLLLTHPWRKNPKRFAPVFARMAERAMNTPTHARVIRLLVEQIASLGRSPKEQAETFASAIDQWSIHDDPDIRAACLRATVSLRLPRAEALVRARLRDAGEDLVVRREAAAVLAGLVGVAAVPDLIAVGDDPAMTWVAVRQLAALRDPGGLELLRSVALEHSNPFLRRVARDAAAAIDPLGAFAIESEAEDDATTEDE